MDLFLQRELHEGAAYLVAFLLRHAGRSVRGFEMIGEAPKRPRPHGCENFLLVLEIAIGRHRAHAQPGRQFAHVEAGMAPLDEDGGRGFTQSVAEIGDIGSGENARHGSSWPCGVTQSGLAVPKQGCAGRKNAGRKHRGSGTSYV